MAGGEKSFDCFQDFLYLIIIPCEIKRIEAFTIMEYLISSIQTLFRKKTVVIIIMGALCTGSGGATNGNTAGYYFLSAHYIPSEHIEKINNELDENEYFDVNEECVTILHGPFKTRFRAIRAMRNRKRKDKYRSYYTKIYKM